MDYSTCFTEQFLILQDVLYLEFLQQQMFQSIKFLQEANSSQSSLGERAGTGASHNTVGR